MKLPTRNRDTRYSYWKFESKVKGNLAIQAETAVCANPKTITTIRVIDIGVPTSQASPAVSESNIIKSLGVNSVSVGNTSGYSNASNSSPVAASDTDRVVHDLKRTLTLVSTLSNLYLGLLIVHSKKQCTLSGSWTNNFRSERPQKHRLPLYSALLQTHSRNSGCWRRKGCLDHMTILKGHLRSYFGTANINLRSGACRTKTAKATSLEKVSRSITSDTQTYLECFRPHCPTGTF